MALRGPQGWQDVFVQRPTIERGCPRLSLLLHMLGKESIGQLPHSGRPLVGSTLVQRVDAIACRREHLTGAQAGLIGSEEAVPPDCELASIPPAHP